MGFVGEIIRMTGSMLGGDYFDFVLKNRMGDALPVFTYHRVTNPSFKAHLEYLRRNGYRTLNVEEALQWLSNAASRPEKAVVLTLDDGLAELYTVAYPLLSDYSMKAVAFLAPAWIGREGLVDWPQIQEMHGSGTVDFQAHSYSHSRIPVSPKIVDFFHPGYRYHQLWEVIQNSRGNEDMDYSLPDWGTPLYASASGVSDKLRHVDDGGLADQCVDYVKTHGGEAFFRKPRWRQKLRYVARTYRNTYPSEESYETAEEQAARVRREVELPKQIIEEKLSNKEVTAFAYPFYERSRTADTLLRQCSYQLVFGGMDINPSETTPDDGLACLKRVTGDFVMRLPGQGRMALFRLLWAKATRRVTRGLEY